MATVSFGLISGNNIRSYFNISPVTCNSFYYNGIIIGSIITNLAYLKGNIPNNLIDYSSKEGAEAIMKSNYIRPSSSGLTGKGVYATSHGVKPEHLGKALLGDISLKNIPIPIDKNIGYKRIIPKYIFMKGNNIQLPFMVGAYDFVSNNLGGCGCQQ